MQLSHAGIVRAVIGSALLVSASQLNAQSLKTIPVPKPPNLSTYVVNETALETLGKALFWDMEVGSDGRTACATCHFHAGADHRRRNQLNPGANAADNIGPRNYDLLATDFPTHKLADANLRTSAVLGDSDDRVGSQGVAFFQFSAINPGSAVDAGIAQPDPDGFSVGGAGVRRVTGRNTPSAINAVFNLRNFWDARAYHQFNGVSPIGPFDSGANILVGDPPKKTSVLVPLSSLASQSVGPPLNETEMSFKGRNWKQLGKKMVSLATPLGQQLVAPNDSRLGPYSKSPSPGLNTTYAQLIQAAFRPEYWSSKVLVDVNGNATGNMGTPSSPGEFTQMQYNFSFFWGLAIQAYETLLVSNDSRFDRFQESPAANPLTSLELQGMDIFNNVASCAHCHGGALFSSATSDQLLVAPGFTTPDRLVDRRKQTNGRVALFDVGFFNIGVRPSGEDTGLGNTAPFDPLSFTRMSENPALAPLIGFSIDPCRFHELKCAAPVSGETDNVLGAFKMPSLRNVELTGPYFHNGGQASLDQVIDFYNRGGDFANLEQDGEMEPRGLTTDQKQALKAFLLTLTDNRVKFEMAPFDHPQLCVPNGHQAPVVADANGKALDALREIPMVGAGGHPGVPLQTFQELLAGGQTEGVDRAHTLSKQCSIQGL